LASMKDIRNRIKSVQSTKQITKAMELVASSKLRKAKVQVATARPYFLELYETLCSIAGSNTDFSSVFLVRRPIKKSLYVLIAGDRGLAGGYNSNMFKKFSEHAKDKSVCVIPIGKKSLDFCTKHGYEIVTDAYAVVENISTATCGDIGSLVSKMYVDGEIDIAYIAYTTFVSILSQRPDIIQVLPIEGIEGREKPEGLNSVIEYEPDSEELFNKIVPQYLSGLMWGAVSESWASELSARHTAMDSASKNADEMISNLSLLYNRARQTAITQEITEVVSGAGDNN
jgi:F-type H+-transporting ATPase subunit gamma